MSKKTTRLFLIVMLAASLFLLCACHAKETEPVEPLIPEEENETVVIEPEEKDEMTEAERVLSAMTLDEKIGQLFIIRPDSLDITKTAEEIDDPSAEGITELNDDLIAFYEKYPAGGFCIFGKNIDSPEQLLSLNESLHALGSISPLLCVDEEGGNVSRLANSEGFDLPTFPNMQTIAESGDYTAAENLGVTIGLYLRDYGFDLDFAPVADVNTNPDNPVIGVRAFGDDPVLAGEMVSRVISGLHRAGAISCIKHFPGHGDTSTDSHLGLAQTGKTWQEMLDCELIPFAAGIEAGTELVMAAHITASEVTGTDDPSSLSYTMLTEKLRNEMGYEGIIITDALSMGAISAQYTSAEAAVKAFQAGADILLMPSDYAEAFEGIKSAVENGEISMERLEESVLRILELKTEK